MHPQWPENHLLLLLRPKQHSLVQARAVQASSALPSPRPAASLFTLMLYTTLKLSESLALSHTDLACPKTLSCMNVQNLCLICPRPQKEIPRFHIPSSTQVGITVLYRRSVCTQSVYIYLSHPTSDCPFRHKELGSTAPGMQTH